MGVQAQIWARYERRGGFCAAASQFSLSRGQIGGHAQKFWTFWPLRRRARRRRARRRRCRDDQNTLHGHGLARGVHVRSVVPVAAYLLLFQLAVLRRGLPAEWFGMACGLVAASESGASGKDESRALHHVVTLDCKPSTAAMAVQTGPASCM